MNNKAKNKQLKRDVKLALKLAKQIMRPEITKAEQLSEDQIQGLRISLGLFPEIDFKRACETKILKPQQWALLIRFFTWVTSLEKPEGSTAEKMDDKLEWGSALCD